MGKKALRELGAILLLAMCFTFANAARHFPIAEGWAANAGDVLLFMAGMAAFAAGVLSTWKPNQSR